MPEVAHLPTQLLSLLPKLAHLLRMNAEGLHLVLLHCEVPSAISSSRLHSLLNAPYLLIFQEWKKRYLYMET